MYTSQRTGSFSCLLSAAAVCSLCLLYAIYYGSAWELNDDPTMSFLYAQSDYSAFQWRLLSVVIFNLNRLFPFADWWTVCSVFAIWIGAVSALYVIYTRFPVFWSMLLSPAYCFLLWYVALQGMNFTRTAAVASMGGIMLIADSIFFQHDRSIHCREFFAGCLVFLFGAAIRDNCAMLALAYLAVIGFVRLICEDFSISKKWFCVNRKQILALCAAAMIFFAAYIMDLCLLTPEQAAYRSYNDLRAQIQDYPAYYPPYEEIQEECASLGVSSSAYDLLFKWITEDTEVFSVENLKAIESHSRVTALTLKDIKYTVVEYGKLRSLIMHFVFVLLIFPLLFIKKRNWMKICSVAVFFICILFVFVKTGRFPMRIYASLLWFAALACLFLSGYDWKDEEEEMQQTVPDHVFIPALRKHRFLAVILAVCLICTGLLGIMCCKNTDNYKARIGSRRYVCGLNRSALEQIHQDPSHIYILDGLYNPASLSTAFALGEPYPVSYCTNLFYLGGWDARHPYNVARRDHYGIENPVRALFERTDVYSAYSERILNYLRSDYDPAMTCTQVGMLNGAPLVQYTPYISDTLISEMGEETVVMEPLECCPEGKLSFNGTTAEDDQEHIFYANITVDGQRYTYRLAYDNGRISGLLYGIADHAQINESDILIFEKIEDSYVGCNTIWQ